MIKETEQPDSAHQTHHIKAALGGVRQRRFKDGPAVLKTAVADLLTCIAACKGETPPTNSVTQTTDDGKHFGYFLHGRDRWRRNLTRINEFLQAASIENDPMSAGSMCFFAQTSKTARFTTASISSSHSEANVNRALSKCESKFNKIWQLLPLPV